ncbi:hypothetical protein ILUMI_16096 [Ignelater luminosus]|uniref:Reverse transcriptase domain-containing protein n=1 Tax=Ignelater luminosus TaxID=2038154 RepID=A0A8K0CMD8_IGNLU|nr:hypothetical protein ILUMI_16096 [Ignelater luminosus]
MGEYQAGFRKGRSTTEQLFTVRQILEKAWELKHPLFLPSYTTMKEIGIPDKLIRLTRISMEEARGIVKIQQHTSEDFEIKQGLKQGDGLTPFLLFNIALDKVVRSTNVDANETILNKERQIVRYANDLDLIARCKRAPRKGYEELKQKSTKIVLEINVSKTKVMEIKTRARLGQNCTIDNDNIEVVREFTYLGSNLNTNNDITQEIEL